MKILSKLVLVSLVVLSASCGKKDKKNTDNIVQSVKNEVHEYKIMGTWESPCSGVGTSGFGLSSKEFYNFSRNVLLKAKEFYAVADCVEPSLRVEYSGNFKISAANDLGENSRSLDLEYKKVSLLPLSANVTTLLNTPHICGIADWEVNHARDVTDASMKGLCELLVNPTPSYVFDIAKVEDGKLYFGKGNSKDSTKTRPVELDKDTVFSESDSKFGK